MRKDILWIVIILIIFGMGLGTIYYLKQEQAVKPYAVSIQIQDDTTRIMNWSMSELDEAAYIEWVEADKFTNWDDHNVHTEIANVKRYENSNHEVFYRYDVTLEDLDANTSYIYRVGSSKVRSDSYTFSVYDSNQSSFSFLYVTDSQGETKQDFQTWGKTLDTATTAFPDAQFIVHMGDLTEDPEVEQQWKWFYQYAPSLTSMAFMPTIGNHEQLNDGESQYVTHFKLPENGASNVEEDTTYYFTYSNMLYISLNTEDDVKEQNKWLKSVLEQYHSDYPWIVVAMHRGVYGASRFEDGDSWVDLFDEYGVNLVLQGHNHEYSRSYPLVNGKKVSEDSENITTGTVYVTMNASGTKFNELKKDKKYQAVHFQNNKQMFGHISIENNKLTFQAYDIDGALLDQFVISQ